MSDVDRLDDVERAALADEVVASLRHDLRNKLASVRGAAFYIKRRLGKSDAWSADARLDEMNDVIVQEITAANALLDAGAVVQRLRRREVARVDAAESVRLGAHAARIRAGVTVDVDAAAGAVSADARELAFAVRCCVDNAVEAGARRVAIRSAARADAYVIEIADDGSGIAAADHEHVFEPFHSTKAGHVGLGLAMVGRIVGRYDGDVDASAREVGACLTIRLPLEGGG